MIPKQIKTNGMTSREMTRVKALLETGNVEQLSALGKLAWDLATKKVWSNDERLGRL